MLPHIVSSPGQQLVEEQQDGQGGDAAVPAPERNQEEQGEGWKAHQ